MRKPRQDVRKEYVGLIEEPHEPREWFIEKENLNEKIKEISLPEIKKVEEI